MREERAVGTEDALIRNVSKQMRHPVIEFYVRSCGASSMIPGT